MASGAGCQAASAARRVSMKTLERSPSASSSASSAGHSTPDRPLALADYIREGVTTAAFPPVLHLAEGVVLEFSALVSKRAREKQRSRLQVQSGTRIVVRVDRRQADASDAASDGAAESSAGSTANSKQKSVVHALVHAEDDNVSTKLTAAGALVRACPGCKADRLSRLQNNPTTLPLYLQKLTQSYYSVAKASMRVFDEHVAHRHDCTYNFMGDATVEDSNEQLVRRQQVR